MDCPGAGVYARALAFLCLVTIAAPGSSSAGAQVLDSQERSEPICGVCELAAPVQPANAAEPAEASFLPDSAHCYEVIPSVVRNDGVDTFRLEVAPGSGGTSVRLSLSSRFRAASGANLLLLRDDGSGTDRAAQDGVFTSEPLHYHSAVPMAAFLYRNTNSPAGFEMVGLGAVEMTYADGSTNQFLIPPYVVVMNSSVPVIATFPAGPDIMMSEHFINVQTDLRATQRQLRFLPGASPRDLANRIYQRLPDLFDFLVFVSLDHVEAHHWLHSWNFVAGTHLPVRVRHTGTGQPQVDFGTFYGSAARLQGVTTLDTLERGLNSHNIAHELLHQWGMYLDDSLGICANSHYTRFANSRSHLGGEAWKKGPAGQWAFDCLPEGGLNSASPLEKYLMGFIDGSQVPPTLIRNSSPNALLCDAPVTEIAQAISIQEIQAIHGVREPGPSTAQREFQIGFVGESYRRFLTPAEMTFYSAMAAHFAKPIPPGRPAPHLGYNWCSIARFFGDDVLWRTRLDFAPRLSDIDLASSGVRLIGSGLPGRAYRVEMSGELQRWTEIGTAWADANGRIEFVHRGEDQQKGRFYRLVGE